MAVIYSLEKEKALSAMEEDFLWLLSQDNGLRYQWTSTKRDLVEMTHEVWLRGVVYDHIGKVKPFTHLLRQVCDIVGVTMPKKPTAMLDSIAHRKDQEHYCMVNRYIHILNDMKPSDRSRPILRFLRQEETKIAA